MATARAICRLQRDTLLPEDDVINVMHFLGAGDFVDDTSAQSIADRCSIFYLAMDTWLSALLSGQLTVSVYDVEAPPPRVPVIEDTYTITPNPSSTTFPAEVALVGTMEATPVSGEIQARRRGRIYLGPLIATAGSGTNGDNRPVPLIQSDLGTALGDLGTLTPTDTFRLAVYSTVTGSATPVTGGWVDNAFDTQRRRGIAATARTSWASLP